MQNQRQRKIRNDPYAKKDKSYLTFSYNSIQFNIFLKVHIISFLFFFFKETIEKFA